MNFRQAKKVFRNLLKEAPQPNLPTRYRQGTVARALKKLRLYYAYYGKSRN